MKTSNIIQIDKTKVEAEIKRLEQELDEKFDDYSKCILRVAIMSMEKIINESKFRAEETPSAGTSHNEGGTELSNKYKLMIYFAHSTMVMYEKTIVSHGNMSVGEFMDQNKDVVKRVFDEGLSIMNYELSNNQMEKASLVYLQSKYYPSSVYEKGVYIPKEPTPSRG